MTDKNDPKNKKTTDDLLEGFDDSFDDAIDMQNNASTQERTEYFDQNEESNNGKTEIFSKEISPGPEKTEFEPKSEQHSEKTQVVMEDELEQSVPLDFSNSPDATRNAINPKVPTEDLASLLLEENSAEEGGTEDASKFEATNLSDNPRVHTEDLSGLMDEDDSEASSEGRTELFEVKTEDFSSAAGAFVANKDTVLPTKSALKDPKEILPRETSSNIASLIEEEVGSPAPKKAPEKESMSEDLSSMLDSSAMEGATDDEIQEAATDDDLSEQIEPGTRASTRSKSEVAASDESIVPARSEASRTIKVRTITQKYMFVGILAVVVVAGVAGFKVYKSKKQAASPGAQSTTPDTTSTPAAPATDSGKVIDSQELLKDLEEKYNQANQYFITDRFQSYTEAESRLNEIITTYPNHKKANARLAEAILLKFDGYLDSDRQNRVYQLLEKAEAVDPNSVETLRAKARLLMFQNKNSEAIIRAQQATNLNPNDSEAHQIEGEVFLALDKQKEALADFSKALDLQPNSNRAKYYYYLTLEKQGSLKAAAAGFAKISSDMNVHPKSYIEKYVVESKIGNSEKAKEELKKYLTSKEAELSPPEASMGWKMISSIERKNGNIAAATQALEKAVAKMALDHEAAYELGNLYFRQNNFEKSSQYYSTASSLSPDNVDYLLQLGISLRNQGKLKEAEEALKKVTTKAPKNFDGLYQYSYTKYKLGFVEDVVAQLQLNIQENPNFLLGKILLGNIQLDKNDLKNSLDNFQQALGASKDRNVIKMALISLGNYYVKQELWAKAKTYFQQANQKDPQNYDVLTALAKISIKVGSVSEVQSYLDQMKKINANNTEGKSLQAGLLARQKEYDKAIELYREIIKANESNYEARVDLAKVYIDKKDYSTAIVELNAAYKYNAEYFYTFYYLGIADREIHDLQESERNLIKATSILPNFYKGHYELGLTYLAKEDLKKGEDEMKIALQAEPSFIYPKIAMGDYYFNHDVFNIANKYYLEADKLKPNDVELMQKLAKTQHELGEDIKAIETYQKVIRLNPSAESYLELGILYEENNQLNSALNSYQHAIASNPKDAKPYYQMGFLYRQMSQNKKAVQAFQNYLRLNPETVEKGDIEDQIKKLSAK